MELFEDEKPLRRTDDMLAPLAERMRPKVIEDFVGQEQILGKGRFLSGIIDEGTLTSLILWGPPGTGKTTLGRIIAESARADFVQFSAVLSGVKDIREVVKRAEKNAKRGMRTILFVDEIHRFNKSQQDAFLHSVEDGTITLIGATTENPSFEINAPLLSRCKVLTLETLSRDALLQILARALSDVTRGIKDVVIETETLKFIADFSHGDARAALSTLEASAMMTAPEDGGARKVGIEQVKEAIQKQSIVYDKHGEEHYNVVSAFIKSMRGSDPDAALYWLARMISGGEDPLFIARRMVIFASEDVGNADPAALTLAVSVKDAVHFVGMPEGWIPLAQGATYLATTKKSNASYKAYKLAKNDVDEKGALPVPMHLRNAPTKLMRELGYSEGYKYPHDYKDAVVPEVDGEYMPDKLKGKKYYKAPNKKIQTEEKK